MEGASWFDAIGFGLGALRGLGFRVAQSALRAYPLEPAPSSLDSVCLLGPIVSRLRTPKPKLVRTPRRVGGGGQGP